MNFFEQELRKLFGDGSMIESPQFVGRACLGTLGGDLRARAEFVTMGYADHYEALRLTVLNRTNGEIDRLTIRIREAIGYPNDTAPFRRGTPYIWTDDGKSEWYGYQPTAADYQALRQAAGDYLDVFRERVPERTRDAPSTQKQATKKPRTRRGQER